MYRIPAARNCRHVHVPHVFQDSKMASSSSVSGYHFTSEPDDDLKCLICLEVALDTMQHEACGKLFCKECLRKYGENKPCPNCRVQNSHFFLDGRSKKSILALGVKCSNMDNCKWEGTIATLEEHLAHTCEFAPLPCPKQCKDDNNKVKQYTRKVLDRHVATECPNRDHTCEYCGEKGTYSSITHIHDKVCGMKLVRCYCPECSVIMERCGVKRHWETCEHIQVPCKYKRIGCDVTMKRKDIKTHEQNDNAHHLHIALNTTVEIKDERDQLKKDVGKLTSDLQSAAKKAKDSKDRIDTLESSLKAVSQRVASPEEEWSTFNFSITKFSKKRHLHQNYTCPAFYTSENGYRMQVVIYTDGCDDGESTQLSAYVHFLEGRNDQKLKWPFVGTVTITLLNQQENKNHHKRPLQFTLADNIRDDEDSLGYSHFFPQSQLGYDAHKNTCYLVNDALFFEVSAEVAADDKPWLKH